MSSPPCFTFRNTWLIFLAQGGFVGAMLSFTGLWGPPHLKQRFALSSTDACGRLLGDDRALAAASPLAGYLFRCPRAPEADLSRRRDRRRASAGRRCSTAPLPLAIFTEVAAITSFACGAVVVAFAFAKESVPVRFLGTISERSTSATCWARRCCSPPIGWVLDRHWSGAFAGGARVYSVEAFHTAFALIAGWARSCRAS